MKVFDDKSGASCRLTRHAPLGGRELIAEDCVLAISRSAADLITRIKIAQRYRYSFGGKESLDRLR